MVNLSKKKDSNIITSGTRKRSVARVTLKEGKGMIRMNGQAIDSFGTDLLRMKIKEPLILLGDLANKVHIDINVCGGGVMSQAEAARLAMCRALAEFGGEKVRKILYDYDRSFLVADIRRKEVCKPNDSKARAKRQKSYR